jgi:hypothetical protein
MGSCGRVSAYGFPNRHTGVALQKSAIGTLAGLLLGKTRLDSVYGLKMSPIVNCATVLAM